MKKPFDLKKFFKYLFSLCGYVFLAVADKKFSPLALPLLAGNVYAGLSPFLSLFLYVLSYIFSFSPLTMICAAFGGTVIAIYFVIMKKLGKKAGFSLAFVTLFAVAPYCVLRDCHNITIRLVLGGLCSPLSFVFVSAAKVFLIKGFKYRLSTDEIVSAAVCYIISSLGAINLLSAPVYETFAIACVLFAAATTKKGVACVIATITAIPLFLNSYDPSFFAPLCLYALVAVCFAPYSGLAVSVSVLAIKAALWNFTSIYDKWSYMSQLFILAPVCVYLFTPPKFLKKLKKKLEIYKDNNLGRYALDRTRLDLSGKLFEIASVFDEMSASIKKLEKCSVNEKKVTEELAEELYVKCCSDCRNLTACRSKNFPQDEELGKIITLATAKGKLNLADLPTAFSLKCKYPEKIAEETNELILESEREFLKAESMKNGRELILAQTDGVSEALKSLAVNMSMSLESRSDAGDLVSNTLMSAGIFAFETLCFGEGDKAELNILLQKKQAQSPLLLKAVKEATGKEMVISDAFNVSEELTALTLKRAPVFDAAFAVSQKTKSDKEKSGDTHSVTKISEGKFLIALNDGMGSGERALETSAATISLIETLYKAHLSSETVLSTVNKILSFNGEDNFTALDAGVIDLFTGSADFIKIGSPYSFVITDDAVKIVEGSSLPLGILEDLRPTVCKTSLSDGDAVVFVSDGVSDAFGSSSDFIDFLSTQKVLNPKTLADNILQKALFLDGGEAKDDMTVFCVRLFKKSA